LRYRLQFLVEDQAADVVVSEARALAQRLRSDLDPVAERQREQALDEMSARSAAGARLALRAHRVEAVRAGLDRGDDLALRHAVAAADLCVVGKGCNGGIRVREGAPSHREGLAEDQPVADPGHVLLLLEQVRSE